MFVCVCFSVQIPHQSGYALCTRSCGIARGVRPILLAWDIAYSICVCVCCGGKASIGLAALRFLSLRNMERNWQAKMQILLMSGVLLGRVQGTTVRFVRGNDSRHSCCMAHTTRCAAWRDYVCRIRSHHESYFGGLYHTAAVVPQLSPLVNAGRHS